MRNLKPQKRIKKLATIVLIMLSLNVVSVHAQENIPGSFGELEKVQDHNMDYLKKIYSIIKNYPSFSYNYEMENGEIKKVIVTGVENDLDKKQLEVVLYDLKSNQNKIKSKANRIGVFYAIDKEVAYKHGEEALQSAIYENIKYPKGAENWGVEGTIYIKFVVDENGQIPFATTSEDIETNMEYYVEDLEEQAIGAIKETSGQWVPGKINGVSVPSLAIVPVTFDFKKDPFIPALIR